MTALSVALVLCCAMVCGTRLVLSRRAERGQDVAQLARQVEASMVETERTLTICVDEIRVLRSEVDALKAQSAFRSLG